MEHEFIGKSALVVGGSSGIGLSAALLLAKRGAKVGILADRGVSTALAFAKERGVQFLGFEGDAAQSKVIADAVAQTVQATGGLHIAVHTACVHPYGNAVGTDEATWDRVMSVNVKSVYLLAHWAIPQMLCQRDGAIVNVASIQGTGCQRDVCAYATSKAAILGLTRTLAVDFAAQGIRANSVSPGSIQTPLLDLSADKFGQGRPKEEVFAQWGQGIPLGRIGQADEVAEVIAFAASSRASYCNGSNIVVDGALSIRLQ